MSDEGRRAYDAAPALGSASTIRAHLDSARLSRAQIIAIVVTGLLSMLDGFDVLSITFVAPALAHDWAVSKAMLGLVLSSGLVGMALGSILIAPLADVVGRRSLLIVGLAAMGLGSLLCAFAHGVPDLCAYRVITGLGIGIVVAVLTPLSAEFANARRRALAVSALTVGYPLGGVVGGLLAQIGAWIIMNWCRSFSLTCRSRPGSFWRAAGPAIWNASRVS